MYVNKQYYWSMALFKLARALAILFFFLHNVRNQKNEERKKRVDGIYSMNSKRTHTKWCKNYYAHLIGSAWLRNYWPRI